jgi:glycosyltransferase involved in cell wall biosynthesis
LRNALKSVAESIIDEPNMYEVLVVDNNSSDETSEVVASFKNSDFPFRLIYIKEVTQGVSYARNRGIYEASGKYIAYMDDDQLLDPSYLSMLPVAFKETGANCIGGKIFYSNESDIPSWLKPITNSVGQIDLGDEIIILGALDPLLKGGNIAYLRSTVLNLGGYNTQFGRSGNELLGGEEDELQKRIRSVGETIAYHPKIIQYHVLLPEKLKKNYWRKYNFGYGRTRYLQEINIWKNANIFYGAPRTFWWLLITKYIPRYIFSVSTLNSANIFLRELDIWMQLGQLYEAQNAYKSTQSNN